MVSMIQLTSKIMNVSTVWILMVSFTTYETRPTINSYGATEMAFHKSRHPSKGIAMHNCNKIKPFRHLWDVVGGDIFTKKNHEHCRKLRRRTETNSNQRLTR